MNGQMDRRADRQKNGLTYRRIDRFTKGNMDGQTNSGVIYKRKYEETDGKIDEQTNRNNYISTKRKNRQMNRCIDRKTDVLAYLQKDTQMDRWTDGQTDIKG